MTTEVKETTGFKPDSAARKLLNNPLASVCAYIYPDGILVRQSTSVKVSGKDIPVEVWHVWHCAVNLRVTGHNPMDTQTPITRIVCHNPTVLLDGVREVEVYRFNASDALAKIGLTCDTLRLTTLAGARHRVDIFDNLLASDYTVQYDTPTLQATLEHRDIAPNLITHC